jgi:hypothetical protein
VGEIEFYGYAGLDLRQVRKALPLHEGDTVTQEEMPALIGKLKQAANFTHVNPVCCDDKGGLMIYIAEGFALPVDPAVRAKQFAMRDYAAGHEALMRRVLVTSSDAGQRAIAAQLDGLRAPVAGADRRPGASQPRPR